MMTDLDKLSDFIENRLVQKYLLSYSEIVFIGIAKRNNSVDGDYVIRFAIDNDRLDLNTILRQDKELNKMADFDVISKSRKFPKLIQLNALSSTERHDPLRPGIEVLGVSKGAISAIVFKNQLAYVLSNAHILGDKGSKVYQPDDHVHEPAENEIGCVEESDGLLDCAISQIAKRDYTQCIYNLDTTPLKALPPEIGDSVMKYGLVSGRTLGIVRTIHAVVKKPFNRYVTNQFIVEPDPRHLPNGLEISVSGDSGAPWVKADQYGNPSDVLVGIECGGDDSDIDENLKAEYAHATAMVSIQKAFNVTLAKTNP
ncbi:MAG: hypothetical protein ACOYXT_19470 [Bacteroidota bacterium]